MEPSAPRRLFAPNAIPSSTREFDVDFLRGVVCLSLMGFHFFNRGLHDAMLASTGGEGGWGDTLVWHWRLGVESFFILAGLLLAHNFRPTSDGRISTGRYLLRRFIRLGIPFWIAIGIAVADKWIPYLMFKKAAIAPPGAREILAHLTFSFEFLGIREMEPGWWSLATLEQFYIVWILAFGVLAWIFGPSTEHPSMAERTMVGWLSAGCIGSISIWVIDPSNKEGYLTILRFTGFLCLGVLMHWAVRRGFAWVPFLFCLMFLVGAAAYTGRSRLIAACVMVAILFPLVEGAKAPTWKVFRLLGVIGRCSYSIYLVHGMVGDRLAMGLKPLQAKVGDLAGPLLFGISMVAGVLAGMIFYRLVEVPCQNWARSVRYRETGGGGQEIAPTPSPS